MVEVFKAPAGTADVERNHKVSKSVHTKKRARTGPGKVERQVACATNRAVLRSRDQAQSKHDKSTTYMHRAGGFENVIANVASDAHEESLNQYVQDLMNEQYPDEPLSPVVDEDVVEQDVETLDEDVMFNDPDQTSLFTRIMWFQKPEDIPDYFLFGHNEAQ